MAEEEMLDHTLAVSLQEAYNQESQEEQLPVDVVQTYDPKSVVDEMWELEDPSPDIYRLFVQFDAMFFSCTLVSRGVAVNWSKRMTLCAGVCSYEGRGGLCSVRLSEPLLKLRPRRDLVQTLLHEMIHAYLFVTENNTDHDGHGPNFLSHMHHINKLTGAKISVYHSFHDEVNQYRQHWWKCDGPCQHRRPFFGMVKRVMNRAPSSRDPWWQNHQKTCGGTYHKVREPEDYGKKNGKKVGTSNSKNDKVKTRNIKDMLGGTNTSESSSTSNTETKKTSSQVIKPFDGRGRELSSSASSSSDQGSLSARERMAAAAERRFRENQQTGSTAQGKSILSKRKSVNSEDGLPSKRQKQDAVIVVGERRSRDEQGVTSLGKRKIPPVTEEEEERKRSKQTAIDAGNQQPSGQKSHDIIDLTADSPLSAGSHTAPSTAAAVKFKTCPVCGLTEIPAAIINAHVTFCLDEECESTLVDDDHL